MTLMIAWAEFFTESQWLNVKLWQWLAGAGLILAAIVVGKLVAIVIQTQARRMEGVERLKVLAMLLRCMSGPAAVLIFAGGLYATAVVVRPTFGAATQPAGGLGQQLWMNICRTVAVMAVGWFIYRLVDILELYLRRWTGRTDTPLDDQLVPLVRKTLRVFVVIVVVLFIAQNIFQWNVGALLAGLGVGGLAIALAARETLANLFGSVTIFSDRPFRLGDRVVVQGHDGFVEEVGFRSTRIRTLEGKLVVIPNATVTSETVENVSARPYIRRVLNVTITYDTPPAKVHRAIEIIREMLDARRASFHGDYPPRVYFSDFNAASLNIVVYYWFTPPDWWEYLAFNDDFNHELLARFNDEGIEFAFPTQTVYVKTAANSSTAELPQ